MKESKSPKTPKLRRMTKQGSNVQPSLQQIKAAKQAEQKAVQKKKEKERAGELEFWQK